MSHQFALGGKADEIVQNPGQKNGSRAGQKVLTLCGARPREGLTRQHLCPDIDGRSLHAAVRGESYDRKRLQQLCRYITRPVPPD